jgi:hypothetical protein
MNLRDVGWVTWNNGFSWLRIISVVEFCKHGSEFWGSIRAEIFLTN